LEIFFHDDTFIDMLDYRKFLEENVEKLIPKEAEQRDKYDFGNIRSYFQSFTCCMNGKRSYVNKKIIENLKNNNKHSKI